MIKSDFIKREAINAGVFNFILNGIFALAFNINFVPVSQKSVLTDTLITVFIITVLVMSFSCLSNKKKIVINEIIIIITAAIFFCTIGLVYVKYALPNSIFPILFKYYIIVKMLWTAVFGSCISLCANTYLINKGKE